MKGKLFAVLTAVVCLATATICTGCGDETSDSLESTTTTAPVATETTVLETTTISETTTEKIEEEPVFKSIGEDTGNESIWHVYFENLTGKDIVGMSIQYIDQEDHWDYLYEVGFGDAADVPFPDENLLDEGDVFEAGETRVFYYDTTEAFATVENPYYMIQITFDDGIISILWDTADLFWDRIIDGVHCQATGEIGYQLRFEPVVNYGDDIIFENVLEVDECSNYFDEEPMWNTLESYTLQLWSQYLLDTQSNVEEEEEITYYEYESNQTAADQTPVEENSNSGNSVDDGCIGEDGIFNDDSADSAADDTVDDGCIGDEGLFNDDDSSADDGCIGDDGLFN